MADDDGGPLGALIRSTTPERVRRLVEDLTAFGPRSADCAEAVAGVPAHLTRTLGDLGLKPVQERYGPEPHQVNIIAEMPGTDPRAQAVEIAAHWDTVPDSPGADDNASGVAGLLEVARCLAGSPPAAAPVRFCLFGEEEFGFRGSRAHVDLLAQRGEIVRGVIVLEMIGYRDTAVGSQHAPVRIPGVIWPPRTADFIAVVSDRRSARLVRAFEAGAARYAPELGLYTIRRLGGLLADAARSDHVPYWRSGRRGLLVTDTANFRNRHYHAETDVPDTLDWSFLAQVARATAGAAAHLASAQPR